TEMARILAERDLAGYPLCFENDIKHSYRRAQLLNGWVAGNYTCFGFPRHDRPATHRVKIHPDLRYDLQFEGDEAFDRECQETGGGLLYINVLFYRVEPAPDALSVKPSSPETTAADTVAARRAECPSSQADRAPSRPLLATERHTDEPSTGGLNYDEAIEEWGYLTSE